MPAPRINTKRRSRRRVDAAVAGLLVAVIGIGLYQSDDNDEPIHRLTETHRDNIDQVIKHSVASPIEALQSTIETTEETQLPTLQDLAHDEDPETRQEAQALLAALTAEETL
jgi:cell division protein FtsN